MTTVFLTKQCIFLEELLKETKIEIDGLRILVIEGRAKIISFKDHIVRRLISVAKTKSQKDFLLKKLSTFSPKQKIELQGNEIEEVGSSFD